MGRYLVGIRRAVGERHVFGTNGGPEVVGASDVSPVDPDKSVDVDVTR